MFPGGAPSVTGHVERSALASHMDSLSVVLGDLQQFIDRVPAAVCVCEAPSGVIRVYNQRAAALWGREPKLGDTEERFCGAFRLFRLDGTFLAHADAPIAETLRDGRTRDDEVVIERPDGSRVTAHVNIGALRDPGGRIVGVINILQDVTDRNQIAETLRLNEARYRSIVEDQPDLVCRFQLDGTLTFANDAYCRYFGRRREDVVGMSLMSLVVHPDDVRDVQARLGALSPTNRVVVIENRVIRGDGAVRWTEWINHAVYDEHGRLLELQSTGRDLTDRKQAEDEVARLGAIVTNAQDAIVSKTLEGIITSWNRAAERMFGYSAAEAVGRSIAMIIPPDRLEEEAAILDRLRAGEVIDSFETERVTK